MNTKLELLGYQEKDIAKEEKIEVVVKKVNLNIHYKKMVPLTIFEKYIVKVIDKASNENVALTKKEHEEIVIDIDKISNILVLDKEIIENSINTLATSNIIELQDQGLTVKWNKNLENWKREVIETEMKEINFLEADIETFYSNKNFQLKFINENFSSKNKIINSFEILSVNDDFLEIKVTIIFDREDYKLKTIVENNNQIFTLSDKIDKRISLKSLSEKKIEDIEKIYFSDEQTEAINSTDKYIVLKARAGSGKTTVITQRVKKLIIEGIHPDQILLLAFNRDAANEMKKRIGNNFNNVSTFHSFANFFIKQYKDVLKGEKKKRYIAEIVKSEKRNELVKNNSQNTSLSKEIKNLLDGKGKTEKLVEQIDRYISYVKTQSVSTSMDSKILEYKNEDYYHFLLFANKVYKKYEEKKLHDQLIDHDDQLIKCIEEINKEDIELLKYILIDEFQDFSPLFYEIIKKIIEFNPDINIFVVGDNWQAINGFSGSRLEYFNNFENYFPGAIYKTMLNNYRSAKKIVEFSNEILQGEKARSTITGGKVIFEEKLTNDLIQVIKNKNPTKEIVILVRTNSEAKELKKLELGDISVQTAHKSKGLQYDIVIIADASKFGYMHPDNKLFEIFGKEENDFLDEEKRLFYVAVTRAKEKVYICGDYSKVYNS